MGSGRQNTDKPPSTQAAATQDWGLSRALSFQFKNFTHFNGHYNFKESNFHHCLSSASWFVERGSFCMNSTQKPAFPLAKELPMVFKPCKLQVQLLNYCLFQWNVFCHAKGQDQTEFNHKQDLHIEKIVQMKRKRRTKGEKTSQVLGNYFRLPYLLNLNNSFLSQRGEKHVLLSKRGTVDGSWHNNT